jgi:hypothetical protein
MLKSSSFCSLNVFIYSLRLPQWMAIIFPSRLSAMYGLWYKLEYMQSVIMNLCVRHFLPGSDTQNHNKTYSIPITVRTLCLWSLKSIYLIFKNSFSTIEEAHRVSVTKRSWLILFKKTIPIYWENYTKHGSALCKQYMEFLNVISCGTYSYCCDLKVKFKHIFEPPALV